MNSGRTLKYTSIQKKKKVLLLDFFQLDSTSQKVLKVTQMKDAKEMVCFPAHTIDRSIQNPVGSLQF